MAIKEVSSKPFDPGTTGWTAADLDDPEIERQWFAGRYEIVEGVLATRPPNYFNAGAALCELTFLLRNFFSIHGPSGNFGLGVDIIIDESRVAVADAVYLTTEQRNQQEIAARNAGRPDPRRTRILIPPLLIIESVSPGHEAHDQRTKRRWYAEFGVPNYWILDAYNKTLECLVLRDANYIVDAKAEAAADLAPSAFPGLTIALSEIW